MGSPVDRERVRRLRIRLAALRRHAAARGPDGRSELAVAAGKASGIAREGDKVWALDMAIRRWHPEQSRNGKSTVGTVDGTSNSPSQEVIDAST